MSKRPPLGRAGTLIALLVLGGTQIVWARTARPNEPADHSHRGTATRPPPLISIGSPMNGAAYGLGQAVAADYSCRVPAPASVTSCVGPVPSGSPIPTSAPGQHQFTVSSSASSASSSRSTIAYFVISGMSMAANANGGPPDLSALSQSAPAWREGAELAQTSHVGPPIGTTFSFALNEPAAVTFVFSREGRSRRGPKRCARRRPPSSCLQGVTRTSFSFPAHGGTNRVGFQGRTASGERLVSGRYALLVTATDAAGRRARSRALAFMIVS